jgi:pyruvate formate lyase activating enzyme
MVRAKYYKSLNDNRIQCMLCPHSCILGEGGTGICRARRNENGELVSRNYGRISSLSLDPIEKKPLYHYYPGAYILSAGTIGCNLKCRFCQNYHIAQEDSHTEEIAPEELVEAALSRPDNLGLAFTYNEPSIWFEFVLDTAVLARGKGLKNVLVTNGFINREPLLELLPYIDAMNIDVKGFTEKYYREICGGDLKSVRETVELAYNKCHVEITTLLVTGLNDSPEESGQIAAWLSSLDRSIPLHLSRYFPSYKLESEPTPVNRIIACRDEALKYLDYVYAGNLWGYDGSTRCPNCGRVVISRDDEISMEGIKDGRCIYCGREINVIYRDK